MPVWPCPECGAKKGDPHKPTCRRVRTSRRQPKSKRVQPSGLPKGKGRFATCWPHKPVVYKTRGDIEYLQCSTCSKHLGSRKKKK